MEQYNNEQKAKSRKHDCFPTELTSQKQKNQEARRQLDLKRKENEERLHLQHKRQKIEHVIDVPAPAQEDEEMAGPSLALFMPPEPTQPK